MIDKEHIEFKIENLNSGKTRTVYGESWHTPEIVFRSEMCWYGFGTVLRITNTKTGEQGTFKKIKTDNIVTGWADMEVVA